jgi:TIR domain
LFISYRVNNNEGGAAKGGNNLAHKLWEQLEQQGFSCYLDQECLQNGEEWKPNFMYGVSHSDVLVLLVSRGSMAVLQDNVAKNKTDNVLEEIMKALLFKLDGRAKIIPINVRVDDKDDFEYWTHCGYAKDPYFSASVANPNKQLHEFHSLEKHNIHTVTDVIRALCKVNAVTVDASNEASIRNCVKEIRILAANSDGKDNSNTNNNTSNSSDNNSNDSANNNNNNNSNNSNNNNNNIII